MNHPLTVERQVHFQRGHHAQRKLKRGAAPKPLPVATTPRISKLMALALHFDHLIQSGHIPDQADLARLGHVTRARITQIMNLLYLAPDIQEDLLFLPPTAKGRDAVRELAVRPLTGIADWNKQRRAWQQINTSSGSAG